MNLEGHLERNLAALQVANPSLWASLDSLLKEGLERDALKLQTGQVGIQQGAIGLCLCLNASSVALDLIAQQSGQPVDVPFNDPAWQQALRTDQSEHLHMLGGVPVSIRKHPNGQVLARFFYTMFVYEDELKHFLPLLNAIDLSSSIETAKLLFFHGTQSLEQLSECLAPCYESISYALAEDMNVFERFKQGIAKYKQNQTVSEALPVERTQTPQAFQAKAGSRFIFIIRVPSGLKLYQVYLDMKRALLRKGIEVCELIVTPGTQDAVLHQRIHALQADGVFDLESHQNFFNGPNFEDTAQTIRKNSKEPWF